MKKVLFAAVAAMALTMTACGSKTQGGSTESTEQAESKWQTYTNNLAEGQFGLARLGWIADYDDASTYIELFTNGNSYNYGNWVNDEYTDLVRTMKCSTGRKSTPTPTGTFTNTGPGARWHYFTKFDCWAQYAYYIEGDILFHSVLYNQKGGKVTQSSVNNLGSRASHGCVRLSVEDAKWIWNNCPANTTVVVY